MPAHGTPDNQGPDALLPHCPSAGPAGSRTRTLTMSVQSFSDEVVSKLATAIEAVNRGTEVLVIFANCDLEYDGQEAGYVGLGDRLVLCKPDGTLLVHRPTGTDPVRRHAPGSSFRIEDGESGPAIVAQRSTSQATVRIYLDIIYQVTRFEAQDDAPLELSGTEAEMHAHVRENPETVEEGLRIVEGDRQLAAGTVDLFANDRSGHPVLLEVKRRRATLNHVDRLRRLLAEYRETNPAARGILVAPVASEKVKRAMGSHDLEFVALSDFSPGNASVSMTISDFEGE